MKTIKNVLGFIFTFGGLGVKALAGILAISAFVVCGLIGDGTLDPSPNFRPEWILITLGIWFASCFAELAQYLQQITVLMKYDMSQRYPNLFDSEDNDSKKEDVPTKGPNGETFA